MPILKGAVIEGTPFEGELNTLVKQSQFTDKDTNETIDRTQLEVEIVNPASGQKALSWFNIPVNDEGEIENIRTRSGLGMLLADIQRLTGREMVSGDSVEDFVSDAFDGKLVKGIVYDEFTWKGLNLTNVAKIQEVV